MEQGFKVRGKAAFLLCLSCMSFYHQLFPSLLSSFSILSPDSPFFSSMFSYYCTFISIRTIPYLYTAFTLCQITLLDDTPRPCNCLILVAVTGGVGFLLKSSFWKPLETRLVSLCLPLPPVGPSRIKHGMMQGWVGCTFSLITCQRVRASEGNVKRYHYLNPLSSKISHGLKGGETHTCDWFDTTCDGLGNGCVTKAQIDTIPQTHNWPQWIHTPTVSMRLSSSQRDALLNRCLLGLTHQNSAAKKWVKCHLTSSK